MVHKVYTPESPDPRAVKRVLHPVPVPDKCPECDAPVKIVHHTAIYHGKTYGDWPWALTCTCCDARVGFHPGTGIPLGHMAPAALRRARMRAKTAFKRMWVGMDKATAYRWLACQLGIPNEQCHVGDFSELMCDKVVLACDSYYDSKRLLEESYTVKKYGPTTRQYIQRREHAGRHA